ncbi:uncharacterized protein [Amphiura filiformis]|uniref:uncharacterized protein n=1 Tax=Amphiura filiformis TaxID=82378 RepID=UPI003B2258FD
MKKKTWDETGRYPHTKRVGPYLVGKILGEGSFAKVKEAIHSVIGEKVAIKVVDKKSIKDDVYLRKNMRREAAILQTLHHPHIVRLYEVMETDNNFYMVLELCTGGPLLDKICSEGKLTEETTKRFVRQMLSAIDHMHQAGVLHRDLKVENLLLDGTGNLKLIDFGLSNFLGSISRNGRIRADMQATQCGSPAYAAPEIIANKRYGAKVDVWSVGVNTFAMLTGTLPFIVEPFNIKVLLRKMVTKDMTQMPKHVSKDCQDFIKNLLQPDPRARPSVRDVMSHPWLAETRPASPRPRTATPPTNGRMSRMDVDTDIVDYIWNTYGIQPSHVSNSVICKRADEYSAIYYLLIRKRDREDVKILQKGLEEPGRREGPNLSKSDECTKDARHAHGTKEENKDKAVLAEMTALQLAGRKHGSLHFKVTTLALAEDSEEADSQAITLGDHSDGEKPKEVEVCDHVDKNNNLVSVETQGERANNREVGKKPQKTGGHHRRPGESSPKHDQISRNHGNSPRNHPPTATSESSGMSELHKYPTAATNDKDKAKHIREAFTSTKTSAIAKRQIECRASDVKTGPFHRQPRKVPRHSLNSKDSANKLVNCAHKVNLTFRQSDPGSKESFVEHFNYRRRKCDTLGVYTSGHSVIRVNLTPIYSPVKAPRRSRQHEHKKPLDRNLDTSITIKNQGTFTPREARLSKLIEEVQTVNAPTPPEFDTVDVAALSKAQKVAMATFRKTRTQRQKIVPPEFQKLESTRRVKVAKRKSIEVTPTGRFEHQKTKLSSTTQNRPSNTYQNALSAMSNKGPTRQHRRRKLSMEETLERYRSRNPARSPCMCQEEAVDKSRNAPSEDGIEMMKNRASTLPDIAPPLVAISPKPKPLGAKNKPCHENSRTV